MHDDADADARFEIFPERPLAETERILESLLARGVISGDAATADDLRHARVPSSAGPAFLGLARRFRAITLVTAEVRIDLHDGTVATDALGGWRLAVSPEEVDLRLGSPDGSDTRCDTVYDATISPHGSGDIVRHSSLVHFLVRAAVGDGA